MQFKVLIFFLAVY